jgi:hypothetical protein
LDASESRWGLRTDAQSLSNWVLELKAERKGFPVGGTGIPVSEWKGFLSRFEGQKANKGGTTVFRPLAAEGLLYFALTDMNQIIWRRCL